MKSDIVTRFVALVLEGAAREIVDRATLTADKMPKHIGDSVVGVVERIDGGHTWVRVGFA